MCSPRGLFKRAAVLGLLLIMGTACSAISRGATGPPSGEASLSQALPSSIQRDADVPDLLFPDNPDPNACGIPTPTPAYTGWVNGVYQGQVIEPTVFLYDSHERVHITGAVPSGAKVQVELYQANPVLDFYFVRAETTAGPQQGWVPAPFIQVSPPSE